MTKKIGIKRQKKATKVFFARKKHRESSEQPQTTPIHRKKKN